MTKKQYRKKCQKLFCKAKRLGVKLKFDQTMFDNRRLDCGWYGGVLASIKVDEGLTVPLEINGDVYAVLYDERGKTLVVSKDKVCKGLFMKNMSPYIRNDKELYKLQDSKRLVYENNNWLEYNGIIFDKEHKNGQFIDLGMIVDNILECNILKAINQVLVSLESIKEDIFYVAKEVS